MTFPLARGVLVLLLAFPACRIDQIGMDGPGNGIRGSGVAATESRDLPEFDRIQLLGFAKLNVEVGKQGPLTITADDNLLAMLATEVDDGLLVIQPDESLEPDVTILIQVPTDSLREVICAGVGEIRLRNLQEKELRLDISGAAEVWADGTVDHLDASVAGAAHLTLADLVARTAGVEVSGVGKIEVHVTELLETTVSGLGWVENQGEAIAVGHVSGFGSIPGG